MRDYRALYEEWLASDYFDETTKKELKMISDDENEIKERFYKDLEFGTAGLRGIMGAGTNRMNLYVIRRSTQGLANYIIKQGKQDKGVAIAFDSRNNSAKFAKESAMVLCANGIKAYIFEDLRPTPMLSFAIRELNCVAGINITASHNPPEYNGYKVYWEDGAQITPPHDKGIMDEVNLITDFSTLKSMEEKKATELGLFEVIKKEVDENYLAALKAQIKHMDEIKKYAKDLSVVYSPLHGTGNLPVRKILTELGFENFHVVKEQELPNGDFPTVSYPNPEDDEAFALGLKLANKVNADIVLATDPDADRLGVRVKDKEGNFHTLTGNMSGCLLAEYEIAGLKEQGKLNEKSVLIKSVVSSYMANAIAKSYGIELVEVLTGFKYIGQKMTEYEHTALKNYAFGFEESYGCLIGDYARDKDAVVATMALCEAACYYKGKGMTLWDAMIELYEKYGYYLEDTVSITFKGAEGLQKIQDLMAGIRAKELDSIGRYSVLECRDYKNDILIDYTTKEKRNTGLPKSDVVYYLLNDGAWIAIRPSGTEPKLKIYVGIKAENRETMQKEMQDLKETICNIAGVGE